MRASLKKSIAESPVKGFERYPKGSIVLCNACAAPIYKLEAGLDLGAKGGRGAQVFKPIALADLEELAARRDIDAGVRATIAGWTPEQRHTHLASLNEPKAGDTMVCPVCSGCFVQILAVEESETHDRAYVIELLTIPPFGAGKPSAVRGRQFRGDTGDWLH